MQAEQIKNLFPLGILTPFIYRPNSDNKSQRSEHCTPKRTERDPRIIIGRQTIMVNTEITALLSKEIFSDMI